MPAIVHKILIRGADIFSGAILSFGQLFEEAQKSRNKNRKYFRSHLRKISRPSTNEDVSNLGLASSDPLISSLRTLPKKATKTYLPESLKLFAVPKESEDLFSSDFTTT
jgi:hypothetical protein